MKNNNIEKEIANIIQQNLGVYFGSAWRDKIGDMLEEESKYARLVEWINKEIDMCVQLVNVFCPADKDEEYTNGFVNTYLSQMQKLGVLVHCRLLLYDDRTTLEIRENIEYTICKLYDIEYSSMLKEYIPKTNKGE